MRKSVIFVQGEEQFIHGNVKDWNDFLRIGEQLMVQGQIDFLHVNTINVEKRPFEQMNLFELLHVEWLRRIDAFQIRFLDREMEFFQEVDESPFAIIDMNIGTPDDHLIIRGIYIDISFLNDRSLSKSS